MPIGNRNFSIKNQLPTCTVHLEYNIFFGKTLNFNLDGMGTDEIMG